MERSSSKLLPCESLVVSQTSSLDPFLVAIESERRREGIEKELRGKHERGEREIGLYQCNKSDRERDNGQTTQQELKKAQAL